jgi:hypothetical protein
METFIIVPVYKMSNKIYCVFYRGMSLSLISFNISTNTLLTSVTLYVDEIFGEHQGGSEVIRVDNILARCSLPPDSLSAVSREAFSPKVAKCTVSIDLFSRASILKKI